MNMAKKYKRYELVNKSYLPPNLPIIVRLDGKAFHTFTKGMKKPFDTILMECMWETAKHLAKEIQGVVFTYTQSDEISLLLDNYSKEESDVWYGGEVQKIVSVSAGIASTKFNEAYMNKLNEYKLEMEESEYKMYMNKLFKAYFDSRIFIVPERDVVGYFRWRQDDATRNAIQMAGQHYLSKSELFKKNTKEVQEMLWSTFNINFNNYPTTFKRGTCIVKEMYLRNNKPRHRWIVDQAIPIFNDENDYISRYLEAN